MNPNELKFVRQLDEPLHPTVLFNRPLRRSGAGRLLVAGGHTGELSLPTGIHQVAMAAGLGECTVVLPDVLAKFLGGAPGTAFAASTPSGSLDRTALGRILELSEDHDAVALGASLSNNSNTSMLIERLLSEIKRPMIVFDEAVAALKHSPKLLIQNQDTLLILSMPEVFKLSGALGIGIHIRRDGGLINKLEVIQGLAARCAGPIAVYGSEIVVSQGSELTVTPINYHLATLPALFYGVLSTFWLQNSRSNAAGLTTGAYVLRRVGESLSGARPSLTTAIAALTTVLKQSDDL